MGEEETSEKGGGEAGLWEEGIRQVKSPDCRHSNVELVHAEVFNVTLTRAYKIGPIIIPAKVQRS